MKTRTWNISTIALSCVILLNSFCLLSSQGQSYTIDWYKVAGGGGTSTGGTYQVSGTIGQPDASGPLTGGSYSLTGGFWSMISVVQSVGVPNLRIVPNGLDSMKILWPDTGSYTLETNGNLAKSAGWVAADYTVTTANGTNSVTVTPPKGNVFFRLAKP